MTAKIKNRSGSSRSNTRKPRGISHQAFHKVYWPYIPLLVLIGLLTSLGVKSGALTHSWKHPAGQVLAYSTSMQPGLLLQDSNTQRLANHDNGLRLNGKLEAAAQAKASDMASRDYWSHVTPEGAQPWIFFTAQGYQYQKAGENLAAGFGNEQAVVNAWMASLPHRHNLLDPAYTDVGFGVANVADYKAAGGGPMTVVVAFYGDPIGSFDEPVVTASSNINSSGYASSDSNSKSTNLEHTTSMAQIGLANLHLYSLTSVSILVITAGALAIWGSRHVLALRKVVIKGESFVFHHPMLDVGLLALAALAFVLNQTAGFIK